MKLHKDLSPTKAMIYDQLTMTYLEGIHFFSYKQLLYYHAQAEIINILSTF